MPVPEAKRATLGSANAFSMTLPYGPSTSTSTSRTRAAASASKSSNALAVHVCCLGESPSMARMMNSSCDESGQLAMVNGCHSNELTPGMRRRTCCPAENVHLVERTSRRMSVRGDLSSRADVTGIVTIVALRRYRSHE